MPPLFSRMPQQDNEDNCASQFQGRNVHLDGIMDETTDDEIFEKWYVSISQWFCLNSHSVAHFSIEAHRNGEIQSSYLSFFYFLHFIATVALRETLGTILTCRRQIPQYELPDPDEILISYQTIYLRR